MDEPEVLALIASACAMTELCLPERQPMGGVYAALSALLNIPEAALWGPSYIKWEIGLLRALGYGLDLSQCALTGAVEGLTHVSPRTGPAAKPYKEKLLPLPAFLTGGGAWERQDIADGLALTGHFFERCVWGHNHGRDAGSTPFPPARERLVDFYRDKT
jgi:DNA repair protein RecO (recombination protein O)